MKVNQNVVKVVVPAEFNGSATVVQNQSFPSACRVRPFSWLSVLMLDVGMAQNNTADTFFLDWKWKACSFVLRTGKVSIVSSLICNALEVSKSVPAASRED